MRALKECRALGCPFLGEQLLQEPASSLDALAGLYQWMPKAAMEILLEKRTPVSSLPEDSKPADEGCAEEQLGLGQAEGSVKQS